MQNMSATRSNPRSTTRKPSAKSTAFQLLLHLAKRHPFVCLFAVWGSFLFFGWLAFSGLTYTNPAPLEETAPTEVKAAPFELSKPMNTFGLILLVTSSCAITSMLLAKHLRPVKPAPRRAVKRQAPPHPETGQLRQPVRSARSPMTPRTIAKPTAKPEVIPPPPARPVMTVLPAEDDSPITWDNFTLAEMLDIRQRSRQ